MVGGGEGGACHRLLSAGFISSSTTTKQPQSRALSRTVGGTGIGARLFPDPHPYAADPNNFRRRRPLRLALQDVYSRRDERTHLYCSRFRPLSFQ